MEIFPLLASYALLGVFAGVIAGLLGVGGGLIVVPILAALFSLQGFAAELTMQLAVGTSLATIVMTSISSVRSHHRRGGVRWPLFWQLKLSQSEASARTLALLDSVRSVGGLAVLLWHQRAWHEGRYPGWGQVYGQVVDHLHQEDLA